MSKSTDEKTSSVELNCGCIIGVSGEINQECVPHSQSNFIQ
ncbi:MAG: hypothetical protein OEM79_02150 [Nitrosopumilus sp.]|nr:hypothetical protein [Nitrosopumilus sp.]